MSAVPATRVTIADIAVLAGVSVPTVSKVLNGKPGVSPATRARISDLLHEHEYEPRRSNTTGSVALVFGELESPWAVALISALEEAAFEESLGILLTRVRPGTNDHWLDAIASKHVDGVICAVVDMTLSQRTRLKELDLPFVVIDPQAMQSTDVVTVGIAHWRGGREATDYLLSLGHRRIALIGGPPEMLFSQARADGFRAGMAAAGFSVGPEYIIHAEYGYESGRDAGAQLLALDVPPTAIFAASDEQAFGVYEAARLKGIKIPDDLSVIGFNDVPIARWASPPLTTVREPIADMAREAVRLLRNQVNGLPGTAAVELATELVVRESTLPPKSE